MHRNFAIWARILVLALAGLATTAPVVTAGAMAAPRALAALDRDIAAAMAHAAALRERLAVEPGGAALTARPSRAVDLAGIADGGSFSSLAALRLAARGLDRRLEALRAALPDPPAERAQIMLIMRTALGSVFWTLEDLPLATAEDTGTTPTRSALLDRLDRALADLDNATAAMARLAG